MSQTRPGSEPPPEVPDEFGAAYRAAYERALHDQTDGPRHRRPFDDADVPERRGGLVVGTHRVDTQVTDQEGWSDRVRDSRLFVPALLLALALLLVLGAYLLGRAFTAAVGSG